MSLSAKITAKIFVFCDFTPGWSGKMIGHALLILGIILCMDPVACADSGTYVIENFASGLSEGWVEKVFSGKTAYKPLIHENVKCVQAISENAASGLFLPVSFSPENYPWFQWKWQVKHVIADGNATTKDGDDFAARVYVIFPSHFFWKTRSLTYVWANQLKKDNFVLSPYTKNAAVIAVQNGPENTGKWVTQTRNIVQDFFMCFGFAPPDVGAVAIMTDTDNTKSRARAWYGPMMVLSRRPADKNSGESKD